MSVNPSNPFPSLEQAESKIHFLKRHLMLTFAKFKIFGHLFTHTLHFKVGRNPKKYIRNLLREATLLASKAKINVF